MSRPSARVFQNALILGLPAMLAFGLAGVAANPQPAITSFSVGSGEGRTSAPLEVLGEQVLVKTAGSDTNNEFAFMQVTVPPMSGPPLHQHTREDETFYVLDGEIAFQVDGKRTIAKAGTALYAKRLTVHTFQNFSRASAHMLVVVAPAGLERLFAEMSAAFDNKPAPDRTKLVALNKKYGITILGPPLRAP